MSDVFNFGQVRVSDANGDPIPGALAYFYIAGTNTLAPIKNAAGDTLANPQTADAGGVFAQLVYADTALKVNVTTADGAAVPGYPMDIAFRSVGGTAAASTISFSPTPEIPESNVQDAIEALQASVGVGLVKNQNLADVPNKPLACENLGLEIGADVQAYDATLVSLAGLSLVAGDLLYATAADTLVRLPKGTAGQVLAVNAGATAPEWVTPPGQMLLGTITTTSGATATLSGLTLTDYKFLRLVLNAVSTNGAGNITINSISVNGSATAGEATSGVIEIDLNTGVFWAATGKGAAGVGSSGAGASAITTASTSVTIGAGGNTFDAGSIRVYGIK